MVDERGHRPSACGSRGLVMEGGSCYSSAGWVTDDEGVATIPHASGRPLYRMSIDGPGPFSPSPPTTWSSNRTPTRG